MSGIAVSVDLDAGESPADLREIARRQCQRRGAEVLLEPVQLRGVSKNVTPRSTAARISEMADARSVAGP